MVSAAQKKAQAKYDRENMVSVTIRFNKKKPNDVAILERLAKCKKKSTMVKKILSELVDKEKRIGHMIEEYK